MCMAGGAGGGAHSGPSWHARWLLHPSLPTGHGFHPSAQRLGRSFLSEHGHRRLRPVADHLHVCSRQLRTPRWVATGVTSLCTAMSLRSQSKEAKL